MKQRILPEKDLGLQFSGVQKPGRYVGGEFGIVHKPGASYRVCVCYPDLYEIGMSNQAVQILYADINSISADIACERVFAPAPDFEALLRNNGTPLYSLEEGLPLHMFDVIAFSLGYELTLTNLFNVLDCGGVPLFRNDRNGSHPIVIAGGPGATNPVPLQDFIDAVFIGEWESGCTTLIKELAGMKKRRAGRDEMLGRVGDTPGMWIPGREKTVIRQVYRDFSQGYGSGVVVPSIRTVQDHGVVEIMRGCPSGCRFCHAGIYYRPQREKQIPVILDEVESLIHTAGYREITLSSLSTADYSVIAELIRQLNTIYKDMGVSFALPSLRINSFTLNLLKEVSMVRKSGLTFAVETPEYAWQLSINKQADRDRIVDIMLEAGRLGWNQAKLYFMIGLPFTNPAEEPQAIIEFCRDVRKKTGMKLNINVGTFVPKPHTPFQWCSQLSDEEAFVKLIEIKGSLENRKTKVSFHSPFVSFLEGVLSRGDSRSGHLFYRAFLKGARLDSWEEYLDRDVWKKVIEESEWDVKRETCRERSVGEELPWRYIRTGVTETFLKREYEKAAKKEITGPCIEECDHPCGVCGKNEGISYAEKPDKDNFYGMHEEMHEEMVEEKGAEKILLRFSKRGKALFLSHINIMTVFERAFQRAGVRVCFSEGFNPKPKLEFARPLSLGVESEGEYMSAEIIPCSDCVSIMNRINRVLPEGLEIEKLEPMRSGEGKNSVMKVYWGSEYRISADKNFLDTLSRELPDYMTVTALKDGYMKVLVEEGTGKGPSLAKFLDSYTNKSYNKQYILKRLMQYAKNSSHERGFSTYEELFTQG